MFPRGNCGKARRYSERHHGCFGADVPRCRIRCCPKIEAMSPAAPPAVSRSPAPQTLGEILVTDGLASKEQVLDALTAQQHQPEPKTPLGEILLQAKAITERALDQALHKQDKQPKPVEEDATIRVETKRLDSVMNLVGELVLGRNRLIKIGTQLEQQHESDPQVRVLSETLAQLNLDDRSAVGRDEDPHASDQEKVFPKLPRMVRICPKKTNKQVHLEMRGEKQSSINPSPTRSVIRSCTWYVMRSTMDRNPPSARRKEGGRGPTTIAASQEGNSIVIRINDDGRGIPG